MQLVGALPGYLADLRPRSRNLLDERILTELHKLRIVLGLVAEAVGMSTDEAMRAATRLLRGEPPRTPRELRLGEKLVEENIAYPCLTEVKKRYPPQLPLYTVALENEFNNNILELLKWAKPQEPRRCIVTN